MKILRGLLFRIPSLAILYTFTGLPLPFGLAPIVLSPVAWSILGAFALLIGGLYFSDGWKGLNRFADDEMESRLPWWIQWGKVPECGRNPVTWIQHWLISLTVLLVVVGISFLLPDTWQTAARVGASLAFTFYNLRETKGWEDFNDEERTYMKAQDGIGDQVGALFNYIVAWLI